VPKLREAVIVDYLRTPFSRGTRADPERDVFNHLRMDNCGASLVKELVKRTKIKPEEIDEVMVGTAVPAGEQATMSARFIMFMAGLPFSVSGQVVERQCGSSMSAIHMCAMEIMLGYSDICMSVGIEHMTHGQAARAEGGGSGMMINERLIKDPELSKRVDLATSLSMGLTAEKLFAQSGLTREDMDKWSVRSHQRATKALQEGYFKGEIMPVEAPQADGTTITVESDVTIRPSTTLEALAALKPAFKPDGQITAANSSPINAGATAMMLMSKEKAKEYKLKPMATIISMGWAGVDPTIMGLGPVPASRKALKSAGMEAKDIDFWEINEAFAIVTLNAIKQLGIDPEKVNIHGGAVAIGHPLGASGNRLVGTLARILNMEGGTYGLATPCIGGGQGVATIIKREKY
jgi:acetyl-CoA acetyltransferase family protein